MYVTWLATQLLWTLSLSGIYDFWAALVLARYSRLRFLVPVNLRNLEIVFSWRTEECCQTHACMSHVTYGWVMSQTGGSSEENTSACVFGRYMVRHSCVGCELLCGDMTHLYVAWIGSSYSMWGHDSFVRGAWITTSCTIWGHDSFVCGVNC